MQAKLRNNHGHKVSVSDLSVIIHVKFGSNVKVMDILPTHHFHIFLMQLLNDYYYSKLWINI